jgi:hypothetical protein
MGLMKFLTGGSSQKSKSTSNTTSNSDNQAWPYVNQAFQPFVNRGNDAGGMLGAMLGMGSWGGSSNPSPASAPTGPAIQVSQDEASPQVPSNLGRQFGTGQTSLAKQLWLRNRGYDQSLGDDVGPATTQAAPGPQGGYAPAGSQQDAFNTFKNNTGFNELLSEGVDGIEASQSSRGLLNSGASLKGIEKFRMGLTNQYVQQFLDNLFKQQAGAMQAGSIITGAGQRSSSTSNATSTSKGSSTNGGLLDVLKSAGSIAGGFA